MESGARGCHIVIAGKLTGQRHRTEKFKEGYIKFCGETKLKNVDKGYAVAKLKPGVIGVTVEIMHPDAKLPDEIDITAPTEAMEKFPEIAPLMVKKEEPSPIVPLEDGSTAEEPAPIDEGEGVKEGEQ